MFISIKISSISVFLGSDKPIVLFFLFLNVKMPTIVGILTFMSTKNFMLNSVEHEKSFITSRPGTDSEASVCLLLFNYQTADDKIIVCKFLKKKLSPSYTILRIQRLEGKQCRYR